jgi:hypothetical protein
MGKRRGAYTILTGKPEERRPLGSPRVPRRIILKWFLKKICFGSRTGLM